MPADFSTRYSLEERCLALEHEHVHHRRGDIWWNFAALFVLALNWFNPIAWLSFLAFRADQELACDAAVAARAGARERHDYARALIKSASRPGLIAACPLGPGNGITCLGSLNHADQLKRRLKMMKQHRHSRLRSFGGAAAVLVVAGLGLSLASPGVAQPQAEGTGQKQHREIIREHKSGDATGERVHRLRVHGGENGEPRLSGGCESGQELVNVDQGTGEQRTRVVLCTTGDTDNAARLRRLEQTRERLAGSDRVSAEHRVGVLAAIDREIARLRAQQ